MQVEIKELNATSKEIVIVVEANKTEQAYTKYLAKAARGIDIPGFRKGKAPLSMVEKLHSERIKDYFEKDFVDEVFGEAAQEHDINFLLYPEVKELEWERGSEMKIVFEIETEPHVEIKQTEGLQVPCHYHTLEDAVEKFITELAQKNTTVQDVDIAEEGDSLEVDLSLKDGDESHDFTIPAVYAGTELPQRSFAQLIGVKTGDTVEVEISGAQVKLLTMDTDITLDKDTVYPAQMAVKGITRYVTPLVDDEFAKDMEFSDLNEMRTKVAEDLRIGVEHRNIEAEHSGIIAKLFTDNQFALPPKTLRYVVREEVEKIDPRYREMLSQYYIQSIVQEMTTLYILNSLKRMNPMEISDEQMEQYIEHRAILEDMSVAAYKDTHKEALEAGDLKEGAYNYAILRGIAAHSEFIEPPAEPEQADETPYEEVSEPNTENKE